MNTTPFDGNFANYSNIDITPYRYSQRIEKKQIYVQFVQIKSTRLSKKDRHFMQIDNLPRTMMRVSSKI